MASPYQVSCHCGQIRLEITAEPGEVVECNCSICARSGFLHWYVEPEQVKLLTEKRRLATYIWRSATGGQHSCPTCGVAVIRTSAQYPPYVSVNARCLEGGRSRPAEDTPVRRQARASVDRSAPTSKAIRSPLK